MRETREFDQEIEDRIEMEIVVDTYYETERIMGWYCYLQDTISFPFKAKCVRSVSTSPLRMKEIVEIVSMDESENCEHDIFVEAKLKNDDTICVPLSQLEAVSADNNTKQAMNDWAYWVDLGYS